jgi:hypothetical protein
MAATAGLTDPTPTPAAGTSIGVPGGTESTVVVVVGTVVAVVEVVAGNPTTARVGRPLDPLLTTPVPSAVAAAAAATTATPTLAGFDRASREIDPALGRAA